MIYEILKYINCIILYINIYKISNTCDYLEYGVLWYRL